MLFDLLNLPRFRSQKLSRPPVVPCYRPTLEGLEDRVVLDSSLGSLTPALADVVAGRLADALNLDINITDVRQAGDGLVAVGTLAGQTFETPLDITASDNPDNPDCPILNLHLGPINLDLLGLNVDTSEICLRVTAEPGDGNLLGNLLCDVANLLNDGGDLGDILGDLNSGDLAVLSSGLTEVLDTFVGQAVNGTDASLLQDDPSTDACEILNLSVGPINLNLLGLDVELDNCATPAPGKDVGGPITVDVSAEEGPGNLLGNLLCDVAGALDNGINLGQLNRLLNRVERQIGRILDRLDNILDNTGDQLGQTVQRLERQLGRLFDRLDNALEDSGNRITRLLDRVEGQVTRALDRIERLIDQGADADRIARALDRLERQVDRGLDRLTNLVEDTGSNQLVRRVDRLVSSIDQVFQGVGDLGGLLG